ncbi:MAG: UTP--glucose-1-phosphate uridylyltransferase [Bacteriovoracaceae bacterium]|nr:UTP--glucose-1-phosphate uridylyltransferase [Bacteriovoracaceae bacterium]
MKIKKAVIPIAGKGTRFLPATKEIAKEIIPILNVPMIHHIVTEAVESGIEQIIFVTSAGKFAVEDYFDRNLELEAFLERAGKIKELELIRKIGTMVDVTSVRQKEQLGLGHAVLMAKELVGKDPFAVLLGDDIVKNKVPCTQQLMDVSSQFDGAPVIGVMNVPREHTSKYGIVSGEPIAPNSKTLKMKSMIEKPSPDKAPTTLATPGRYILTSEIFSILKEIPRGAGNEYQLTDAINVLCERRDVYAHQFDGERFDTGHLMGYLDATVDFALNDEKIKNEFVEIIKQKITKYGIKL